MNTKLLFSIAYRAIIDEIHERQARKRLYETGLASDLPFNDFLRHLAPRHDMWAQRDKNSKKEHETNCTRLDALIELVQELEILYKQYHDKDDAEWAQAMADYVRSGRKEKVS